MNPDDHRIELTEAKRTEFIALFAEFVKTYPNTPDGQKHVETYAHGREEARHNYATIVVAADQGEDVTDQVLLKLLPYADSPSNRQNGAWIHVAPAVTGDIKKWFERKGWTEPEDWPRVAQAILRFARRCHENPHELRAACEEFDGLPYSTGFQTGMLTPILNSLRPDYFLLINNKPRQVINYLAHTAYGQRLTDYPDINNAGRALIQQLSNAMHQFDVPSIPDDDLFDMFCHWLAAIKKFSFRAVRYWKIAPGENAWNWDACREGGFIAIGWDELDDVAGLSRNEFNARRDQLTATQKGWSKSGVDQVWTFARIQEGDRIVVNRGTAEVLGIGTVVGPYYFVAGQRHGHRLPVVWDDLTPRQVDEYGWRRTLVELDSPKFEAICSAPPLEIQQDMSVPFSYIFKDRQEAEWAFDLLRETLDRLGVADPGDERFALTMRRGEHVLRLNFGNWAILHFDEPGKKYRVGMALVEELAALTGDYHPWDAFAQSEPSTRVYELPLETVKPLEGSLRQAYEKTLVHIAERFRTWKRSNYREFNQPEIVEAVFDPAKRGKLLDQGLTPQALRLGEPDQQEPGKPVTDGYFNPSTFDLLAQLHEQPSHEFYSTHKDALREHVIEPFKQLMVAVRDTLPAPILERMETEKRVFANILKQFVKQGCWDFYWGAFYPKGGKRTEDAQLFLSLNRDRLEFGFNIGEYGSEQRSRFVRNCQENYEVLVRALRDNFAEGSIQHFGEHRDLLGGSESLDLTASGPSFEDWLKNPAKVGIRATVFLPKLEVLRWSKAELIQKVSETFHRLFPLVLLSTLDDPMPAVGRYLEMPVDTGLGWVETLNPEYSLAQCASAILCDEALLQRWVRAIERKGQAILYGPPGTGKTYLAEHLARHLVGGGDGFIETVQFHPEYSYEDFVQGIRPQPRADGQLQFPVVPGRFLDFCEKARECRGRCVLIIDEINRANLARVFGELMYLLEYRDREVPLASGGSLRIPANVRIIGTMNTADRSIALVDHALRRRFAFLALYPNYDVLEQYHHDETGFEVKPLIEVLRRLNKQIGDRHYEVGITFFLRKDLSEQIEDIWQMEIEPYLEEYFFDQPDKVEAFRWDHVRKDILAR